MNILEHVESYAKRIKKIHNEVGTYNFTSQDIESIVSDFIQSGYSFAQESKGNKKHVISRSLLKNFTIAELGSNSVLVHESNGTVIPRNIDNVIFCLPKERKNNWSSKMEDFFSFTEDQGKHIIDHFSKEILGDFKNLLEINTKPLQDVREIKIRLLMSLYVAIHLIRGEIRKNGVILSDEKIISLLIVHTSTLFTYVWQWCKTKNPVFIIPIEQTVTVTRSSLSGEVMEYVFPIMPNLSLFIAKENFDSFAMHAYIFGELEPGDSITTSESGIFNSSEQTGQQKFFTESEKIGTYISYHSNERVVDVVEETIFYSKGKDIFATLNDKLSIVYPYHVLPSRYKKDGEPWKVQY